MSKLFEQFMKEGIILHLQDTEKHDYISFLKHTWSDNLDASRFNLIKFPRWSIIAGYYAMHDMAKLFLAKEFNLKITQRVHTATTLALENVLKDKEQKKTASGKQSDFFTSGFVLKIHSHYCFTKRLSLP